MFNYVKEDNIECREQLKVMSPYFIVHPLLHYINMACSQPKHVVVRNALLCEIVAFTQNLLVISKPPSFLNGMCSDKFYFMTFCRKLSQTDVGKAE